MSDSSSPASSASDSSPSSSASPRPLSFNVSSPHYPAQTFQMSPSSLDNDSSNDSIDLSASFAFPSSTPPAASAPAAPVDPKAEMMKRLVENLTSQLKAVQSNQMRMFSAHENRHTIEAGSICRKICSMEKLKSAQSSGSAASFSFDACLTSCANLYVQSYSWIRDQLGAEIEYSGKTEEDDD
jgi:hypothetical protein